MSSKSYPQFKNSKFKMQRSKRLKMKKRNSIFNVHISIKEAKKIALGQKKEMDEFYKKYWLEKEGSKELIIILKSHLYIESLLDDIITCILPESKRLLTYKFSSKVDLFESFNIAPNKLLIEKLRTINAIRNRFVHDLDKKLLNSELDNLIKDIKIPPNTSNLTKLKASLRYIVGYLHALKINCKLFPVVNFYIANYKNFKHDRIFSKEIFKNYPWKKMWKIMNNLKL